MPLTHRCRQPRGIGVGQGEPRDVPLPSLLELLLCCSPGHSQPLGQDRELPTGREILWITCACSAVGMGGTGQGDAHGSSSAMDLHGFIVPSAGVGTGMVSLRFLSLGDGFLHSLCCFPFIPKACGPCLDFPQAMAGRSSLGTAGSCPSVPVQQFCWSGRCCLRR